MSTSHYLYEKAASEIDNLKRENARLREALGFYASLAPFKPTHPCDIDVRFQIDGGEIARTALKDKKC